MLPQGLGMIAQMRNAIILSMLFVKLHCKIFCSIMNKIVICLVAIVDFKESEIDNWGGGLMSKILTLTAAKN